MNRDNFFPFAAVIIASICSTLLLKGVSGNTWYLSSSGKFQLAVASQLRPDLTIPHGNFVYSPYGIDVMAAVASFGLTDDEIATIDAIYGKGYDFLRLTSLFTAGDRSTLPLVMMGNVKFNQYVLASSANSNNVGADGLPDTSATRCITKLEGLAWWIRHHCFFCKFDIHTFTNDTAPDIVEKIKTDVVFSSNGLLSPRIDIPVDTELVLLSSFFFDHGWPDLFGRLPLVDIPFIGLSQEGTQLLQDNVQYLKAAATRESSGVEIRSASAFCYDVITLKYADPRFSLNLFVPREEFSAECIEKILKRDYSENLYFGLEPTICAFDDDGCSVLFPEFFMSLNNPSLNFRSLCDDVGLSIFCEDSVSQLLANSGDIGMKQFGAFKVHSRVDWTTSASNSPEAYQFNVSAVYRVNRAFGFQVRFRNLSTATFRDDIVLLQGMVTDIHSLQSPRRNLVRL